MRFGVKARWKDADSMIKLGTDLIEVFIHERDLEQHYDDMVSTFSRILDENDFDLVVHNQEYWTDGKNYHLVDLASQNEFQRQRAVKIVKSTLELARKINASYVIVHPGGISPNRIEKKKLLSTFTKSLKEIKNEGLIVENMPWFYIMHDGEIWRSNICVDAEDFFNFSELVGGVTLDICHAYLSTQEGKNEHFQNMKKKLGKDDKTCSRIRCKTTTS